MGGQVYGAGLQIQDDGTVIVNSPAVLNFSGDVVLTETSDHVVKITFTGATGVLANYGKNYITTLTQTGTSAPTVATPFVNQLSAAIVWTYVSSCIYDGTLANAFKTDGSTKCTIPDMTDIVSFEAIDANRVRLTVNADGVLTSRRIEINTL